MERNTNPFSVLEGQIFEVKVEKLIHNQQMGITNTKNSLIAWQSKDNRHKAQEKIVFDYLQTHVASASMVTDATGVPQKCVTRYKRKLERMGLLKQIKRERCKITGRNVWYLTTNKGLFPKYSLQLTLFNLWKCKQSTQNAH